jgi:hypothetical protein
MEGALRAWEALQRVLKVAGKEPDAVEVRAWVWGRDIDPNKIGNFIVGDGRVHV